MCPVVRRTRWAGSAFSPTGWPVSPSVSVATIVVALGLGFAYDPVTAFAMVGTGIVILLVAIYILANITCIAYFLRRRRSDFNVFLHLVVPILGVAAFVPPWLTAAGLPV